MLSVKEVRDAVPREWGRFLGLLPPDGSSAWAQPTRCQGWDVADLAAHTVWGVSMEADALRRSRLGIAGPADGQVVEAAGGRRLREELEAACRDLFSELDEITDDDGGRPVPLPYGTIPLETFLQILTMEAGVHAADLAAAFPEGAADAGLPADVAVATAAFAACFLPALAAMSGERPAGGTVVALLGRDVDLRFRCDDGAWALAPGADPSATVEADDDSTVLLYALGRVPARDPRLRFTGAPDAAAGFKRWFPGP